LITPLLMPFYFDYDPLLLAVPAVLVSAEFAGRSDSLVSADRWLIRTWMLLGLWLLINPGIARITHVNIATLLLTCLSVQLIGRALRKNLLQSISVEYTPVASLAEFRA